MDQKYQDNTELDEHEILSRHREKIGQVCQAGELCKPDELHQAHDADDAKSFEVHGFDNVREREDGYKVE